MDDLLVVYPNLKNDEKEYKKVKERFDDSKISAERVVVQPLDMRVENGAAIVECKRDEQYLKTESRAPSIYSGLWRTGVPTEGSSTEMNKKTVKKSETVWMTLQKVGDTWTIASLSDKKP